MIRPLAAEAGISVAQLAIAWILENPAITAPIVGATRPAQLDDAAAAVASGLDAGMKVTLDELTDEFRLVDADR